MQGSTVNQKCPWFIKETELRYHVVDDQQDRLDRLRLLVSNLSKIQAGEENAGYDNETDGYVCGY